MNVHHDVHVQFFSFFSPEILYTVTFIVLCVTYLYMYLAYYLLPIVLVGCCFYGLSIDLFVPPGWRIDVPVMSITVCVICPVILTSVLLT